MAVHGTLNEPFVLDEVENISQIPMGDLVTPTDIGVPDLITALAPSRFPVPPTAWGFLTDILELEMAFSRVGPPYVYTGLLYPESPYLEPTIGQIWPR